MQEPPKRQPAGARASEQVPEKIEPQYPGEHEQLAVVAPPAEHTDPFGADEETVYCDEHDVHVTVPVHEPADADVQPRLPAAPE